MSDDLIRRSDAKQAIYELLLYLGEEDINTVVETVMKEIPSADRPSGEWINFFAGKDDEWLRSDGIPMFLVCNKCHGIVMSSASARWDFCPNCGARMKGAEDETD